MFAEYVPLAKKKRDRFGRVIGGLRERQIVAAWKASPEYALWKIRGLRESVSGLREDWGKFDAERAAKVFAYNKPEGSDAQMRVEHAGARKTYIHGFADAGHARAFVGHLLNQSGIHARPWKDANGYHVQVTHGARASQAESSWSSPSIEVEVLAEHARESLRERMRPVYPTATLNAEIAAGAMDPGREAVAGTSQGQLARSGRFGKDNSPAKRVDPMADPTHDMFVQPVLDAMAKTEDGRQRLARLALMRRRLTPPFVGGQNEADAGMNLTGGDNAMTPEDARQQAVQDQIDEDAEPQYLGEDGLPWSSGKKYLRDEETGELYEVDWEEDGGSGSDHGSHALPTLAREPEEHGGAGSAAGDAPGDAPVRKPTHKNAIGAVGEAMTEAFMEEMYVAERASHTRLK